MGQVNNNYSQTDYSARVNSTEIYQVNLPKVTTETKFIKPDSNKEVQFWASVRSSDGKEVLYRRIVKSEEPLSFKDLENILDYNPDQLKPTSLYAQDRNGNWFQYQIGQGITDGRRIGPDSVPLNREIQNFINENQVLNSSPSILRRLTTPSSTGSDRFQWNI